jgi:hypothetical protein
VWRRRVVNFVALLSLLLCAATLTLGLRGDQLVFTAGGRLWWVMFGGSLNVVTVEKWPGHEGPRLIGGHSRERAPFVAVAGWPYQPWRWRKVTIETLVVTTRLDAEGLPMSVAAWDRSSAGARVSAQMTYREVSVPTWMVVLATAALPAVRAAGAAGRAVAARRRKRVGTCAYCGYDLRASPGRCPECGTLPAD